MAKLFGTSACVAAVVLLVSAATAARAEAHAAATTVVVTLTNATVTFRPSTAPTGTVVFRIVNRAKVARDFRIGGKRTASIAAGKSATLQVAFSTRGTYSALSVGRGHAARLTGALDVFEPCTNPSTTTINVQMAQDQGGLIVSQTTIPCGTVTFVVTDVGMLQDSLHVFADRPEATGTTPELKPGQTARLTVRFTVKGIAHLESGDYPPAEPEFGGDYGEQAQLAIV